MPPVTPRSTRATQAPRARALLGADGDLALGDLLESHRQVVLRARLDERGWEVVEGPFAELMVVVVDLPGTLRPRDHERISRAGGVLEQIVEPWIHHRAERLPASSRSTMASRRTTAWSTSSLVTTWSKSAASSICARASASRSPISPALSVARSRSRRSSSPKLGARTKML